MTTSRKQMANYWTNFANRQLYIDAEYHNDKFNSKTVYFSAMQFRRVLETPMQHRLKY